MAKNTQGALDLWLKTLIIEDAYLKVCRRTVWEPDGMFNHCGCPNGTRKAEYKTVRTSLDSHINSVNGLIDRAPRIWNDCFRPQVPR
jgi:hypothetical protein